MTKQLNYMNFTIEGYAALFIGVILMIAGFIMVSLLYRVEFIPIGFMILFISIISILSGFTISLGVLKDLRK